MQTEKRCFNCRQPASPRVVLLHPTQGTEQEWCPKCALALCFLACRRAGMTYDEAAELALAQGQGVYGSVEVLSSKYLLADLER